MPIRPENKDRYPKNWPQISAAIRERAMGRCEECGVENYALGGRAEDGVWWPAIPKEEKRASLEWPTPGEWWLCRRGITTKRLRIVRIVLTVAHLDHQPENCDPSNLRALCQRCHNRYDAAHRRAGIRHRARAKMADGDLLGGEHA